MVQTTEIVIQDVALLVVELETTSSKNRGKNYHTTVVGAKPGFRPN